MQTPKRKPGRPGREPAAGERVGLSLRVTPETKRALEAATKRGGRSLSQEAEIWIESFRQKQELLPQLLQIAYGRRLAGLLLTLGRAMKDAGGHAGIQSMNAFTGDDGWFDNPIAYDEAVTAAHRVLHDLSPTVDPATAGVVDPESAKGLGELFARGVLRALSNPEVGGEIGEWAAPIRDLLGPAVARIPGDYDAVAVNVNSPNATTPAVFARLEKSRKGKGSGQ